MDRKFLEISLILPGLLVEDTAAIGPRVASESLLVGSFVDAFTCLDKTAFDAPTRRHNKTPFKCYAVRERNAINENRISLSKYVR